MIGGGPAGLMAAEVMADAGLSVDLYDTMPSVGRKFLLAGIGGLNLTHSEPLPRFVARYGKPQAEVAGWLGAFGPQALRDWAEALGVTTFVGSSGRVFPRDMKAAPLLRAWLHRLRGRGVRFHMRHRWLGWSEPLNGEGIDGAANARRQRVPTPDAPGLRFSTPSGGIDVRPSAVVLALGGASWPHLGSDGAWVPLLRERGVVVEPLKPANCGFDVGRHAPDGPLMPGWSGFFSSRHAGKPLKSVALGVPTADGPTFYQRGEFIITAGGVEGSLVYAVSAALRDAIASQGMAQLRIDLLPDRSAEFVLAELRHPRGSRSLSTHLKSRLGIDGVKAALLHELLPRETFADTGALATALKSLPLSLTAPRPIDEAISTAGGVAFESLGQSLVLNPLPGVFCAGEMLDWEAPTGGYLLTACMAGGRCAGQGAVDYVNSTAADR